MDYLIQTKQKTLFVCEIKFSRNEIGFDVINQVKEKIKRLSLPRGYSCSPVLTVANDVKPLLFDEDCFFQIIDLCNLLE